MVLIMTILTTVSRYWSIGIGFLVVILGIAVKFLAGSNFRLRQANKTQKARNEHMEKVMVADDEIDEQADIRLADEVKKIEDSGVSDRLADPDRWVRNDKGSE